MRQATTKGQTMTRRIAVFLMGLLASSIAAADSNALVGTWKLKSFVREITATGERYNQFGERPDGYLGYSDDGRMYVMIVARDRPTPAGVPTDAERIELHKSMIAYGGGYRIEGASVVHHIDIAWDGTRLGSDQLRFFSLDGDILTLKTPPLKSPVDGREGVGILIWEKVRSSSP
jgi:Lipocalin-like domain